MDKQIITDGVDVSGCKYLYITYPERELNNKSACYAESERCVKMIRCEACPNCYYKQLKRKEQECEELKNFHINLVGVKECEIKELIKLKQTLTEIKEIAEFGNRPYKLCGEYNECCDVLNEIWNKISEVIDENTNN